ncbi:MAG: hemolysin III family protein [Oscillospiraceae bacterium]|nr:hemolysin III family protein [Oscillospiraceae bacterium]
MEKSNKYLYKKDMPVYTKGEEIFNVITHGTGVLAFIVGAVFLIIASLQSALLLFCSIVYTTTSFLLYATSTIYHVLPPVKKIKSIFRKLDHCSIFLFIAGSYMPISMLLVKGRVAIYLAIIIWLTAILGVVLNLLSVNRFSKFSLALYIIMGWASIFLVKRIFENSSSFQIIMLITGGIVYTLGAVIYVLGKKIKYMHSVWHLFVLIGSVLHFLLVYSLCLNPK